MDGQTLFPSRAQRAQEFDEEAVRDFLVDELGLEIPRLYRYDQGIHEIHRRLITRFGDEHFARAMGIFQNLLEGEDNANGLGDDGDLYRSWRHDYKMRKVSWLFYLFTLHNTYYSRDRKTSPNQEPPNFLAWCCPLLFP
jgi:hypothetical protein